MTINMNTRWTVAEIPIGTTAEATFWGNPVKDSGFRYRAMHLDGRRAPKVVLCDDSRIRPGVPCIVRVLSVSKPERDDRGAEGRHGPSQGNL